MNIRKNVRFRTMFICFIFFLTGCHNSELPSINKELNNISSELVPDRRTGICDIKAEQRTGGTIILHGITTEPKAASFIINTLGKKYNNLVDSILILPDTVVNKKYFGLVSLSVINLRKEPDHRAELVSQAVMGTPLLILQKEDSWIRVQTPDQYISWTDESSVSAMTSAEMNRWRRSERLLFNKNSGQIYCSPYDTCIESDIVSGSITELKGSAGKYVELRLPDGRTGFSVRENFISFDDFCNDYDLNVDAVLKSASLLTGLPYLWGGASSKGVDCSGLVKVSYFMNGLIMPRDASQQALCGIPVDVSGGFDNLQKGDLLFFGSVKESKMNITHVAIYKGHYEFIHSSGMVKVNSLDSSAINYSSYRRNSLLKASRLKGNSNGIVLIKNHPWYKEL